jgi:hypothetical protein
LQVRLLSSRFVKAFNISNKNDDYVCHVDQVVEDGLQVHHVMAIEFQSARVLAASSRHGMGDAIDETFEGNCPAKP